jgi:iron complex transport system permease protein
MKRRPARARTIGLALALCVPAAFAVCLCIGPTAGMTRTILWDIRAPRVILAMIVGAGLAAAGCAFQGMLRNPLAEPYTLGVSGGAALGATLAIVTGASGIWEGSFLPVFACGGALLSVLPVYVIAGKRHFAAPTLILAGVVMSIFFSSIILLLFAVSPSQEVHASLMWLMGDFSWAGRPLIAVTGAAVALGAGLLFVLGRDIDMLSMGDEKAAGLGVSVLTVKRLLFVAGSLIAGACVASAGMIGFVGLMIPHIMRQLVGPSHRALIVTSAMAGAVFLAAADTIGRTAAGPLDVEVPVGAITGIVGGVFFLGLLARRRRWEM